MHKAGGFFKQAAWLSAVGGIVGACSGETASDAPLMDEATLIAGSGGGSSLGGGETAGPGAAAGATESAGGSPSDTLNEQSDAGVAGSSPSADSSSGGVSSGGDAEGGRGGDAPAPAGCVSDADCARSMLPEDCAEARCHTQTGSCVYAARDRDGDGSVGASCVVEGMGALPGEDCDDDPSSERAATVHPGALEDCNGMDDDCDGDVDEEIPPNPDISCVVPLGATELNACRVEGHATCVNGTYSGCDAEPLPAQDDWLFCDGLSHDCDDNPNDGCPCQPRDATENCDTSDNGCDGTRTCGFNGWGECQLDPGASCECRAGTSESCAAALGCPGVRVCGLDARNVWGGCQCTVSDWVCMPGDAQSCTSSEGCGGTRYCDGNGHWESTCHANQLCPSNWSNEGGTCVWHSAHEGQRIAWGQSSCANDSDCATYPLDGVTNASPTNDMYLEVQLDQSPQGCTFESAVANWIGCRNPSGSVWGDNVKDSDFANGRIMQLRCEPGATLVGHKYSWGHYVFQGCMRGMTIIKGVNHDGVANACTW